jgi:uncharacterized protein YutE (UPF0331/DUF86 family)
MLKDSKIDPLIQHIDESVNQLRNRLAHLYWEVSNEELYKYIQNELSDFDTYVHHILDFVEKQGESDEQE